MSLHQDDKSEPQIKNQMHKQNQEQESPDMPDSTKDLKNLV